MCVPTPTCSIPIGNDLMKIKITKPSHYECRNVPFICALTVEQYPASNTLALAVPGNQLL